MDWYLNYFLLLIEQPENITTCVAFGPLEMDENVRTILDSYNIKLY
jgi:hypothetical protein